MARMVALARKPAPKTQDADAPVSDDAIHVHLSDAHVKKLGLHGNVEAGRKLKIRAKGEVHHSSTDKQPGEKPSKSLGLRLTHMAVDAGNDDDADAPVDTKQAAAYLDQKLDAGRGKS